MSGRFAEAKRVALLVAALLPIPAFAQAASSEIGQLFAALESSGCRFHRNGKWYDATQASAHLHRKYDYLQKKRLVGSTETFIERAASISSLSGKPYLVRCGAAAPVESRTWFLARLVELRNAARRR